MTKKIVLLFVSIYSYVWKNKILFPGDFKKLSSYFSLDSKKFRAFKVLKKKPAAND